ncbi:inosine guanosine and xanthosine phosphorylase family protein [Lactarius indigo]|nr:inosine guanosine and xanthosine phosphorylase family protein [Lactarius indigo]
MSPTSTNTLDVNATSAENVARLVKLLPADLRTPRVGIVCGSGLGTLAESITERVIVPYSALQGFGESTVSGHRSELAFGKVGDLPVVAMLGRFHPYEGHSLATVVYPIRLMADLGVQDLIITNAAGSLKADVPVGTSAFVFRHPHDHISPYVFDLIPIFSRCVTVVVIDDHIALPLLTGLNPLLGALSRPTSRRFVPLSDAYTHALRLAAFRAAHALGLPRTALAEGTYAWVSGPTYETRGEAALLATAGASVVGMSTVPEVVAARDEGMRVLVLSLVTNMVVGVVQGTGVRSVREELDAELAGQTLQRPPTPTVSHEEVLAVGKSKAEVMRQLVERIIISLPNAGA